MERLVEPEILDRLAPDDPEAIGSRRDLRRINALMGNFRWMKRAILNLPADRRRKIVEVGAGDGGFLHHMKDKFTSVQAVDLAPRPEGLSQKIEWRQGDVFSELTSHTTSSEGVLAANLFLHHFQDDQLEELGALAQRFDVLCFSEPWRSQVAMAEGYTLWPFVNRVTRHDMIVSIRAGFVRGELPALLGMGCGWDVREEVSFLGACRLLALKKT